MTLYKVEVEVTVGDWIYVEADSEREAEIEALELFDPNQAVVVDDATVIDIWGNLKSSQGCLVYSVKDKEWKDPVEENSMGIA